MSRLSLLFLLLAASKPLPSKGEGVIDIPECDGQGHYASTENLLQTVRESGWYAQASAVGAPLLVRQTYFLFTDTWYAHPERRVQAHHLFVFPEGAKLYPGQVLGVVEQKGILASGNGRLLTEVAHTYQQEIYQDETIETAPECRNATHSAAPPAPPKVESREGDPLPPGVKSPAVTPLIREIIQGKKLSQNELHALEKTEYVIEFEAAEATFKKPHALYQVLEPLAAYLLYRPKARIVIYGNAEDSSQWGTSDHGAGPKIWKMPNILYEVQSPVYPLIGDLMLARASAVKQFLVENYGIKPSRIGTKKGTYDLPPNRKATIQYLND